MSSWVHLHNTPAPTFSRLFRGVSSSSYFHVSPPSHRHKHKQTNVVLSKRGPRSQGRLRLLSLRASVPANSLPHLQSSNGSLSLFPSFLPLSLSLNSLHLSFIIFLIQSLPLFVDLSAINGNQSRCRTLYCLSLLCCLLTGLWILNL